MKKREERKALIFYSLVVFLFFALFFGNGITRIYGFTLFPDEFGYWSSAAAAAGYDWSGVTAYGSYYSFGYSLILTPILWFGRNALWTYRLALGVNALLLAASFMLLKKIAERLIPHSAPEHRILCAGIAVCYPTWLLYMSMTMTEILLVFCYLLVCELFLRYLERPTPGRFTAAGISAVYMYTVHMRSVPVLCACVGCMVLFWIAEAGRRKKETTNSSGEHADPGGSAYLSKEQVCPAKKGRIPASIKLIAALAMVGAAFLLAGYLKSLTQASVYGKTDGAQLSYNDYSGQLSKIKVLFTWKGLKELTVSLLGKVYYLAFASFGLFFAGVWFFIKKTAEKGSDRRVRIFGLFVLLSTVGEILVCAVYTRGYGRIDGLCYGRYDEQLLPVLMAFGCYAVLSMKHPLVYGLTVIFSGIPITAILESIIINHQLTNLNGGYFIAGLSYLLRYIPFEPENYFWKAYALAAILCAAMLAILRLIRRQDALRWLLLVWIGVEVLLGINLNENLVYGQSRVRYQDMRMVSVLEGLQEEKTPVQDGKADGIGGIDVFDEGEVGGAESIAQPERRIVCFGGADTGSYASVVQFWMREETIYFYTPEEAEELRDWDLVLVCEKEDRTVPETNYTEHEVYGIFHLYYNK